MNNTNDALSQTIADIKRRQEIARSERINEQHHQELLNAQIASNHIAEQANKIAEESNRIAEDACRKSKRSNIIAAVSSFIALASLAVAIAALCV